MISRLLIPALSFIKIIYSEACNNSFSCDLDEKNDYYENKNRIVSESLIWNKFRKKSKNAL